MALRIELENLWRRLSTRFKARRSGEEDEGYPVLLPKVQPITNFDELAKELLLEVVGTVTRAVAGGAGLSSSLTVPDGERWTLFAWKASRTGGDGTLTQALVHGASTSNYVVVYTQAAASAIAVQSKELTFPYVLDQGMGLMVYCDALTGDSTWQVTAYYAKEEAF